MLTKVFVYGTLMKGHGNARLLDGIPMEMEGVIKGADMFDLWGFPGILKGTGTVKGEVYYVDDATLANLDRLEGVAHGLYTREPVTVHGHDGSKVKAQAYFYASGPGKDHAKIESGNWKTHRLKAGRWNLDEDESADEWELGN